MSDSLEQVSVESPDGRILTGVGAPVESLQETVESRSEAAPEPVSDAAATPSPERSEGGQFKAKEPKGRARFQELTSERDTYKGQAESALERAERAERELSELKSKPQAQSQPVTEPEPAPVVRARPSEDEVGAKYPTYADFVEDLADWKAEKRILAAKEEFQQILSERDMRQSLSSHVQTIGSRGREAYKDFDTVIQASPVLFSPDHQRAILMAPHSEHVQYALASDLALAERIAAITDPFLLGLEFAKLGPSSVSAPSSPRVVSPASTPAGVSSKAPAPYQPVGTGTKTTSPPLEDLAAAGDYEAYKARRSSDLRAVARR